MKIILGIVTLLLISCNSKPEKNVTTKQESKIKKVITKANWESFVIGDIDNDTVIDTAFIYTPAYYEEISPDITEPPQFAGCVNKKCYNKIKFSCKLPEIFEDNTLWGSVEPIEDLDEDGIKEFIFQTNWWIGSHVQIKIFSYNKEKKKWVILAQNSCYGEDSYKDRVTKINKEKFKFRIEYMDTIEQDLSNKDTIIKIKK